MTQALAYHSLGLKRAKKVLKCRPQESTSKNFVAENFLFLLAQSEIKSFEYKLKIGQGYQNKLTWRQWHKNQGKYNIKSFCTTHEHYNYLQLIKLLRGNQLPISDTWVQCYKTFCRCNLLPFLGNTVILCYKAIIPQKLPWNGSKLLQYFNPRKSRVKLLR